MVACAAHLTLLSRDGGGVEHEILEGVLILGHAMEGQQPVSRGDRKIEKTDGTPYWVIQLPRLRL